MCACVVLCWDTICASVSSPLPGYCLIWYFHSQSPCSHFSINNKLQQPDAAGGVLEYALQRHQADLRVQEEWYESLHDWDKANLAYEKKQYLRPNDYSLTLGRMRCLDALGEW